MIYFYNYIMEALETIVTTFIYCNISYRGNLFELRNTIFNGVISIQRQNAFFKSFIYFAVTQ